MELEINQRRMDILCSMPFVYITYFGSDQVNVVINPMYRNKYLMFTNQDGVEEGVHIAESTITRTRKGFTIQVDETVYIFFLNLVPVTPMVIAQLSLVGK